MSPIKKMIGIFLFLSSFSLQSFAKITNDQASSVDAFITNFIQSYENRDLQKIMHFYDSNAIVIGTGQDDVYIGQKNIAAGFQRDFIQSSSATIKIKRTAMTAINSMIFASYDINVDVKVKNGAPFKAPLRLTVALLRKNHGWLIVQSHLSAPLPNQNKGEAFPN
jgi:ketosteroid isomerase-like protein